MFAAPRPPTDVSVGFGTGEQADTLFGRLRVQPLKRLAGPAYFPPPSLEIAFYAYRDACPPGAPTGRPVLQDVLTATKAAAREYVVGSRFESPPGRWCFVLVVRDQLGRSAGPPVTTMVDIARPGPQAAFETYVDAQWVAVDDRSSIPGDGRIESWRWDFGDPGSADNIVQNSYASHTYAQPGTYTITLTVADEFGQQSTTTRDVVIDPPDSPSEVADRHRRAHATSSQSKAPLRRATLPLPDGPPGGAGSAPASRPPMPLNSATLPATT
jgi:hypothetical protein